jgi:hypothetical protein
MDDTRGYRGAGPFFLNLGIRWRRVSSSTLRPLYSREESLQYVWDNKP